MVLDWLFKPYNKLFPDDYFAEEDEMPLPKKKQDEPKITPKIEKQNIVTFGFQSVEEGATQVYKVVLKDIDGEYQISSVEKLGAPDIRPHAREIMNLAIYREFFQ